MGCECSHFPFVVSSSIALWLEKTPVLLNGVKLVCGLTWQLGSLCPQTPCVAPRDTMSSSGWLTVHVPGVLDLSGHHTRFWFFSSSPEDMCIDLGGRGETRM